MTMDPDFRRRVLKSIHHGHPPENGDGEKCKVRGCDNPPDGLDGACERCTAEAEAEGRWSTGGLFDEGKEQ